MMHLTYERIELIPFYDVLAKNHLIIFNKQLL